MYRVRTKKVSPDARLKSANGKRFALQIPRDYGKLANFGQGNVALVGHRENQQSLRPSVWVLTGHKAGDNTQVLALANALGWPYETRQFSYRSYELFTNRLLGATLAGIDKTASGRLDPPWPDLVITAGRRNEPVARWIREQSGGVTRLVHVGRPWSALDVFDLIIVTRQYFVPARHNVLYVELPLHALTRSQLDATALEWQDRFAALPRPFWSVLLGGNSGPFIFDGAKARWLAQWLNRAVAQSGGAVLVSDSARTPEKSYREFLSQLHVPVRAFHWGSAGENPYRGFLAVADRLVVTGESMSMLAEAVAARRPLYIFDLSDCPSWRGDRTSRCLPWWLYPRNYRYRPLVHRLAMWLGPTRMKRDVTRIQSELISAGRAVWAGQEWRPGAPLTEDADLANAVQRVRGLFGISVS